MRKVFLDELPHGGIIGIQENQINWEKTKGNVVHFIYDNIEGDLEIVNYDKDTRKLSVKYLDKIFDINSMVFKKCGIGNIIGTKTTEFKIKIGKRFQDDKRDVIIIDRKKIQDKNGQWRKYYKYYCNKCSFNCKEHYKNQKYKKEYWIEENVLLKSNSCVCCENQIVVEGINDIPTTAPEMVKYFQGGYDEAKLYTCRSNKNIIPICPDCGKIKDKPMKINAINTYRNICCTCSDKLPYTEKFLFNILEQLDLKFNYQPSRKIFVWCDGKIYDFYIPSLKIIIETHGMQHYSIVENFSSKNGRTLEEEKNNDMIKKKLAIKNGIELKNYVVIDCRESNLEFIKQNILKSRLNELFDLSKIDWLKAEEFALSNLVKTACEYKRNNPDMTINDISILMKLDRSTIRKYLKQGNKLEWCYYNPNEEKLKGNSKSGKLRGKKLEIFKNDVSLGIFNSASELSRQSEKLFGIKLNQVSVSESCRISKKYKGFLFRYI